MKARRGDRKKKTSISTRNQGNAREWEKEMLEERKKTGSDAESRGGKPEIEELTKDRDLR